MIDLAIEQHMEDLPSKRARRNFLQQYTLRKRSPAPVVAFSLLLGGLGVHRFYLRQNALGVVYLVAVIVGWAIDVPLIAIGVYCLCIFDACNSSSLAARCNYEIAREIMDEIAMLERCNAETLPLPPTDS